MIITCVISLIGAVKLTITIFLTALAFALALFSIIKMTKAFVATVEPQSDAKHTYDLSTLDDESLTFKKYAVANDNGNQEIIPNCYNYDFAANCPSSDESYIDGPVNHKMSFCNRRCL